ncbi:MAG: universal stress protein [Desulfobacterales bacterium]
MLPDIKKILYATDLSESARHAFGYAASLADRYGAKIVILHVIEDFSPSVTFQLATMFGEEKWKEVRNHQAEEVLESIRKRLEKFCREASPDAVACDFAAGDILVKTGEPVNEILEQAEQTGCDLIVMGTHGQGMFAEALMGSTARRVVRRSQTPVLVVRLPEEKGRR